MTGPPSRLPERYRPEIDGLRALSILAVVLYHAKVSGLGAGYLGVDVFFVISGFLITGQLLREAEATGAILLTAFYARRVRRLVPAFFVMALGTSVLALIYLLPMTEQRLFGNALSRSALFYYNIAVWRGGYAYDGEPADQQVLMHTWSLGIEEQFYLIWPWICLLAVRLGRPFVTFASVVLASLVGTLWILSRDVDAAFFLLPFRVWELALGACAATQRGAQQPRAAGALALLGACLVMLTLLSGPSPVASIWPQLQVSLGTAMFVAYGAAPNPARQVLSSRPMVTLGRMSYSWYLWHWPLLVIPRLATFPDGSDFPLLGLSAGLLAAVLTHVWVEEPLRRVRITEPRAFTRWGLGALIVTSLLGLGIEVRSNLIRERPENAAFLARVQGAERRACESAISSLGCDLGAAPASNRSLLLWGDSFARALSPALSDYSRGSSVAVRLLVQSRCPPLLGAVPASLSAPLEPDGKCRDMLEGVQKELRRSSVRVDGVILAGRWTAHVPGDTPGRAHKMFDREGREIKDSSAVFSRGLAETLNYLESLRVPVLIVGAPPAFPFDVPRCLWRSPGMCWVDRSFEAVARAQTRAGIEQAIRGRNQVRFVELFDVLCPGPRCSAGTSEEPLVADRSHLTARAAKRLVLPILKPYLDWLGGPATASGFDSSTR